MRLCLIDCQHCFLEIKDKITFTKKLEYHPYDGKKLKCTTKTKLVKIHQTWHHCSTVIKAFTTFFSLTSSIVENKRFRLVFPTRRFPASVSKAYYIIVDKLTGETFELFQTKHNFYLNYYQKNCKCHVLLWISRTSCQNV